MSKSVGWWCLQAVFNSQPATFSVQLSACNFRLLDALAMPTRTGKQARKSRNESRRDKQLEWAGPVCVDCIHVYNLSCTYLCRSQSAAVPADDVGEPSPPGPADDVGEPSPPGLVRAVSKPGKARLKYAEGLCQVDVVQGRETHLHVR